MERKTNKVQKTATICIKDMQYNFPKKKKDMQYSTSLQNAAKVYRFLYTSLMEEEEYLHLGLGSRQTNIKHANGMKYKQTR